MKESFCGRHPEQRRGLHAATRFAEDQHVLRVAAEIFDVVAHPLERRDEIEHADVAREGVLRPGEVGKVEKAETAESMVDGDVHDVAAARRVVAGVDPVVACVRGVPAAVNTDHDRTLPAILQRRRPDVHDETVFAGSAQHAVHAIEDHRELWPAAWHLRRLRSPEGRVPNPGPWCRPDGRHESVLARGAGAVGDTPEHLDALGRRRSHVRELPWAAEGILHVRCGSLLGA